jgi:hypothetical protein
VHRAPHDHAFGGDFIEKEMPVKGAEDDKKSPVAKPRMLETAERTNVRMLFD